MKSPVASRINWVALILVVLPQIIELIQGSPIIASYPQAEEWLALIGGIAVIVLRTGFTAEATTLATDQTLRKAKRTVVRERRITDRPIGGGKV